MKKRRKRKNRGKKRSTKHRGYPGRVGQTIDPAMLCNFNIGDDRANFRSRNGSAYASTTSGHVLQSA
jgi:hypothetical protein